MEEKTVYIISGPVGVGKSTIAKALAKEIKNCVYIEGDFFLSAIDLDVVRWEDQLAFSWEQILFMTKACVKHGLNVVIDFVVEEELPWLEDEVKKINCALKYFVLIANREDIVERLTTRGDIQSLDRSIFLLNKLTKDTRNDGHVINTSKKSIIQITEEIMSKK